MWMVVRFGAGFPAPSRYQVRLKQHCAALRERKTARRRNVYHEVHIDAAELTEKIASFLKPGEAMNIGWIPKGATMVKEPHLTPDLKEWVYAYTTPDDDCTVSIKLLGAIG